MRFAVPLTLVALMVAAGPMKAAPISKVKAARLAFLAELAPHSCSEFQADLSSQAAWMVASELRHADLFRTNQYGIDIVEELQKFESDMTKDGPEETCKKVYNLLGPNGFGLVKP